MKKESQISAVVSETTRELLERARELAAEGYGYYSQEASEFACCCLGPSSEVICRCS